MTDVCAIDSFELDMVIGHDAQDFTARFAPVDNVGGGSLLYIDGTEYGGIVDEVTTDTESDAITCHGRTWDGMLACKRIMPPSGSAYRTVSGEANGLLASLVTLLDIGDVFAASTDDSGITVSSYQFERFVDGYEGIAQMLDSAGAKLVMRRLNGKTVMSAEAKLTIGDEADSDLMDFSVTKTRRCVNHLVCAGEGDLQDRVVIDLYSDANGNVSTTQTFTGRDEITAFYDYNNADAAELLAEGTKKLQEYFTKGAVDISRIGRGEWHVGDVLVARDNQSGVMVSTSIAGKTVQVDKSTDWQLRVGYVVGEAERMNPSSNGTAETPEKANADGSNVNASAFCEALHVGDYVTKSQTANVSVANNAVTNICSVELDAGLWILRGNVRFASNATGYRAAIISQTGTSTDNAAYQTTNAVSGTYTFVNVIGIKNPSSTTSYYLNAQQNSGGSLNAIGYLSAVRIK